MTDRCKSNCQDPRCLARLTEMFRQFEADKRLRDEQRLAAIYGIKTYQSKELGTVTIPE